MSVSEQAIRRIIAAEAGIDEAQLRPEATLAELDIGSLDVASALFALEDEFGIEVEPDAILPDWTLARLTDHILSLAQR